MIHFISFPFFGDYDDDGDSESSSDVVITSVESQQ